MINFIKKINWYYVTFISFIVISFGFTSLPVFAATTGTNANAVCNGVVVAGGASCDTAGTAKTNSDAQSLLSSIINILSWAVGFIAVLMIIIGGLLYVIASGDSTKTARAQKTIIYAVVGLIIVAMAQVIVSFILGRI